MENELWVETHKLSIFFVAELGDNKLKFHKFQKHNSCLGSDSIVN